MAPPTGWHGSWHPPLSLSGARSGQPCCPPGGTGCGRHSSRAGSAPWKDVIEGKEKRKEKKCAFANKLFKSIHEKIKLSTGNQQ